MKKKNGLTLVELLVALVILSVIILIAVSAISNKVSKSKRKSLMVSADSYIKAVNEMASLSVKEDIKYIEGTYTVEALTASNKISLNGKQPTSGYVVLDDYEVVDACLVYDNLTVIFENGLAKRVVDNDACVINTQ